MASGAVTVKVEKPGYKPWSSDARLKPGESRTLDAQLEPLEAPPTHAPTPPPSPTARAVREGDLVPITDDVTPPRKIKDGGSPKNVGGKRGLVVVSFIVDIDGRVTDAKISESGGDALDKAVLEAVQNRRYEPATLRGTKVRVVLSVRFEFRERVGQDRG